VTRPAPRAALERMFRAALAAADPVAALRREVRARGDGALQVAGETLEPGVPLHVLAVGKAAAPMARAIDEIAGPRIAAGLLIGKPGRAAAPAGWTALEAAHPVPDATSERAGRRALGFAAETPRAGVLVVLLSGGASSLMACPQAGLSLEDVSATTRALLAAGAAIDELNAVRKHLAAAAGGRLAAAAGAARVIVLAVSDVSGDRFDLIGSGPCAADASRSEDALAVLDRRLPGGVPAAVRAHLLAGVRAGARAAGGAGALATPRVPHVLLAGNATAVEGARAAAERLGYAPIVVARELAGEARRAGARLAAVGAAVRAPRPVCLIAGGETTVHVRGGGRGGRSQELALAAAEILAGDPCVCLLAAGTDGEDGPTDAAGAFADGATLARALERGLDARAALAANDAYAFFEREGGLLRTGPTGTNVRDLVLLAVEPRGAPIPVR
jgi:glycerate-2-kinase